MSGSTRVPCVDHRLTDAKGALAALILITRALSQADDLSLPAEIEHAAWNAIGQLAEQGYADVTAAYAALPNLSQPAPDAE